jgi:hypothetical protein
MLKDESEGSRREISGIRTLAEAEEALTLLRSLGARNDDPIRIYLSGASFSFWVGRPEGDES